MNAAQYLSVQYSTDNLKAIYDQHISLTGAIGIDRLNRIAFERRLQQEIQLIHDKVLSGNYRFSQYKEKLISKGAGKEPRVISIPTYRDRISLRALCNVLKQTFGGRLDIKLPQHTIAELKSCMAEGTFAHFIKIDVTNFYPSIDHDVLQGILRSKIRKKEIHSLIRAAIETPTVPYPDRSKCKETKGVPQGLSISNILAEIYISKFDRWAGQLENTAYFRYVDDILILTNISPVRLFEAISAHLQKHYGLHVHDLNSGGKSMTGKVAERFSFLGYEFKNAKASVKIESIRRLESSLANIFTTFKYRLASANAVVDARTRREQIDRTRKIFTWRLNLRVTGCIFDSVRRGWIFYFSQIDGESLAQLHHLDKTIRALCKRFNFQPSKGEIKSFVRTFHEAKRSNLAQEYIPNFDTISTARQRELLSLYGLNNVSTMPDEHVARAFKRRIRRETSELEQDIQGGSRG